MAKVPYSPVPEHGAQSIGSPMLNPSGATGEAFGAGVGAAIQGLGKEIGHFGNVLGQHAVQMQILHNQAEADEKAADYVIEQAKIDSAHRALEGKARTDAFDQYVIDSKALREKYSSSLSNPHSRKLFDSETRRYFSYSVRNEAVGVGTALKQYNTQSNSRLVTTGNEIMLGDPASDQVFTAGLDTALRGVRQEGVNKGWSYQEVLDKEAEITSDFWQGRIRSIANYDPEKAVDMFEKNKEKILPSKRDEVENNISAGKLRANSKSSFIVYGTQQLIDSDIKSVMETGQGVPTANEKTIRAVMGDKVVEKWKRDKEDAQKIWRATHNLATQTPEQMEQNLNSIAPKPGSPNFGREQAVYEAVKKTQQDRLSLRNQDPALSVSDDPAIQNLQKRYPSTDSSYEGAFGRRLLIEARFAAQTLAGIPENVQSPITSAEATEMMVPLTRMLPGQENQVFKEVTENFKKTYGDYWERAFQFAMRNQQMSSALAETGTTMMKRILRNTTPTTQDAATADTVIESSTANSTINNIRGTPSVPSEITMPPTGAGPVPAAATPPPKKPLSEKILKQYPPR